MGVSAGVLLLCIVVGTSWYTTHSLNNAITYPQAVLVGMVISVCTGVVYAGYNVITISYLYPHFLDEVVRVRIAQDGSGSFAACARKCRLPASRSPISCAFRSSGPPFPS
jgi:hypothetical protein